MNRRFALKTLFTAAAALLVPFARSANAATTHQVTIQDFVYKPDRLNVKVGDTIVFTNKDGAPHTATARDRSWDTKSLRRNKSAEIEVTADMHLNYFCKFHPDMQAKLRFS